MDGWQLFLKKVKSSELSSLYYILAECFPVKIDEGKIFVYARKEFFRSVIEEHKEAVNEMFEKITGCTIEITTTQGKRIQIPVKEEETEIQVNAVLRRVIFRKENFYILYFESENSDFTAKGQQLFFKNISKRTHTYLNSPNIFL